MKKCYRVAAGAVFALAATLGTRVADAKDVTIELINVQGQSVGRAAIAPESEGVRLRVDVADLAPGSHGIHFHDVGKCEPPSFASAGGHFNPDGKHHGLDNPAGPHGGDFPNLVVGADGSAHASFVNPRVTLATDGRGLLRSGGTSLVIHADPDDEKTDPAGNSGARIACGVIAR
jgi:Cu-Zn family superoxide dismutase